MKFIILALALCGVASARYLHSDAIQQFDGWANFHGKVYSSAAERQHRLHVYQENLRKVLRHNSDPEQTYTMKLNQFADLTVEEFQQKHLSFVAADEKQKFSENALFEFAAPVENTMDAVDWTSFCSPVKDQGQCGSCWAFSTTGSVESAYRISSNKTIAPILAEQELVDCSWDYGNYGCNGGLMTSGLQYIQDKGIHEESADPYTAEDGTCKNFDDDEKSYKISGYAKVKPHETDLASAVSLKGPVTVAIDATGIQFYHSGIFSGCGPSYQLNHGVLAVGYGRSGSTDYWLVKNSWGKTWGEHGYFRMKRGKNMCGIQDMTAFPIL